MTGVKSCRTGTDCDKVATRAPGCANTPESLTKQPEQEVCMATRQHTHENLKIQTVASVADGVNLRAAGAAATGCGVDHGCPQESSPN